MKRCVCCEGREGEHSVSFPIHDKKLINRQIAYDMEREKTDDKILIYVCGDCFRHRVKTNQTFREMRSNIRMARAANERFLDIPIGVTPRFI